MIARTGALCIMNFKVKWLLLAMAVMLIPPTGVWAAPKTPDEAGRGVAAWLNRDATPLGTPLGGHVLAVSPNPIDGAGFSW